MRCFRPIAGAAGTIVSRRAVVAGAGLAALAMVVGRARAEAWQSPNFQDHPLVGKIYSAREAALVDDKTLFREAASADFLLLGETHDNADHHRLQARVIAALAGRFPAVVFEMIPAELAGDLAAYLEAHPKDAAGLGEALAWESRGWPAWDIYRQVAEAALAAGLALRAGDLDTGLRKRIGREGLVALAAGERARLALDRPLPEPEAERLKETLRSSHCGMLPEEAVDAIFQVQRARDAALADAMTAQERAILIAGRGHVRADYGVPWYLRARQPRKSILTVGFVEVDPAEEAAAAYLGEQGEGAFDFLWFTPKGEIADHCAGLKERFGKRPDTNR